jgi:dTDP-4-amino-4,6-dideoxygalactose transaminase
MAMITKEPHSKIGFQKNHLFTKSARNAFLRILRKMRDNNRTLLLPAYIGINNYEGSGVFDVVTISRIPYKFYELNTTFSPDLNSLEIEPEKKYCLLLIHYFGFAPDNFAYIDSVCKDKGILLIEDCAHTLTGTFKGQKLGSYGQFAFHSIHKILPTDDGGILVDNTGINNFNFSPDDEGIKMETIAFYALAKHEEISQRRIENYNLYLKLLEKAEIIELLHPVLEEGIVPLNFPILIKNGQREKLYFELEKAGIVTCALYYQLIPQLSKSEFPISFTLSESILNLPVHQDTEDTDIEYICKTINSLVKSL